MSRVHLRSFRNSSPFLRPRRFPPPSPSSTPAPLSSHASAPAASSPRGGRRIPALPDGPSLAEFIRRSAPGASSDDRVERVDVGEDAPPYPLLTSRSFHLKTHGCQMNESDTEIVRSVLLSSGMVESSSEFSADVSLVNTCAIREGAEDKIWNRLRRLRAAAPPASSAAPPGEDRLIGVLGCMASRLKEDLLGDGRGGGADLVVGPDGYRQLPRLLSHLWRRRDGDGDEDDAGVDPQRAAYALLDGRENYEDVVPVSRDEGGTPSVGRFVTIMRGCNNMCSYCIVPFTRGRERSRALEGVVEEVRRLVDGGTREVVLLGQNVNSYHDRTAAGGSAAYVPSNPGFSNLYRLREGPGRRFADLLAAVSDVDPELRVRFTSPHPKDYPPELLSLMAERDNVCGSLHMPAQSGSTATLARMRRGYTREAYLRLIDDARAAVPGVCITSDFISGFCGETEEEHRDTLSLIQKVGYDAAYMFAYSLRQKTHAHRRMEDDVAPEVKKRRLAEVMEAFHDALARKDDAAHARRRARPWEPASQTELVLVEGHSKKSTPERPQLHGRSDGNRRVVFDLGEICAAPPRRGDDAGAATRVVPQAGDYVAVAIQGRVGRHGMGGQALWRTGVQEHAQLSRRNMDRDEVIWWDRWATKELLKNPATGIVAA